ncbi:hypothetical protein NSK_008736 [Nannochloropsis salina CCMP1776]|uniref:Uncharacterized protein n=1 Tax=Nannochloropsis salina CCMP1776 TaxID=1027361 RepID=A0A4D9CT84_9STRA|nr:hypothetical protein NSK_008736 [Nannochloropsis salina CCMP1776]|eukprot:TFJ79928.1 hypothetical protein NSK_008736 [Nannochloropsis salina CCMP1776]
MRLIFATLALPALLLADRTPGAQATPGGGVLWSSLNSTAVKGEEAVTVFTGGPSLNANQSAAFVGHKKIFVGGDVHAALVFLGRGPPPRQETHTPLSQKPARPSSSASPSLFVAIALAFLAYATSKYLSARNSGKPYVVRMADLAQGQRPRGSVSKEDPDRHLRAPERELEMEVI